MKNPSFVIRKPHCSNTTSVFAFRASFQIFKDIFNSIEGWEPNENEHMPDIDSKNQYELELEPGEDYLMAVYGTVNPSSKRVYHKYLTQAQFVEFCLFWTNISSEDEKNAIKYYQMDLINKEEDGIEKLVYSKLKTV